jgi:hypothetical protein
MRPNRGRTCARCHAPITLLPIETEAGLVTTWLDETRCVPMGLFHYYDRTAS